MTTQYADDIASAGRDIADAGAPVTFTRAVNTVDVRSGDVAPTQITAVSSAIRVKPYRMDLLRYEALGLTLNNPVTLVVAASGLAFAPLPGDVFAFGAETFTVRTVDPIAPDGAAILYRVIGAA